MFSVTNRIIYSTLQCVLVLAIPIHAVLVLLYTCTLLAVFVMLRVHL